MSQKEKIRTEARYRNAFRRFNECMSKNTAAASIFSKCPSDVAKKAAYDLTVVEMSRAAASYHETGKQFDEFIALMHSSSRLLRNTQNIDENEEEDEDNPLP